MRAPVLRGWYAVHRWTSLICTINLLILCVTGLLLVFHDEIDAALGQDHRPVAAVVGNAAKPSLQTLADSAVQGDAAHTVQSMFFPPDEPSLVAMHLGERGSASLRGGKNIIFNMDNGMRQALPVNVETVTGFLLKLHVNLFLGLPGQLFIGLVGLIFVLSIVSGIVIYAPLTRKLVFGILRFGRQARIVQADLHNLFAVTTMVWALVVGLTGTFLAFSPLIIGLWQKTELTDIIRTLPAAKPHSMVPVDQAIAQARLRTPGKDLAYVFYPGTEYATQRHYMVVQRGHSELEQRLFSIVVVDAQDGTVADARGMPWYMQALLLSGPFHFGDYAGLPLKILWALLTLLTATVTVSGFIVWMKRTRAVVVRRNEASLADGLGGQA